MLLYVAKFVGIAVITVVLGGILDEWRKNGDCVLQLHRNEL